MGRYVEIARQATWNEANAERLLQETLDRIARAFQPTWRERMHEAFGSTAWLEAEARIEAAAFVHDMPAFVRAVSAYEGFVHQAFTGWAKEPLPP